MYTPSHFRGDTPYQEIIQKFPFGLMLSLQGESLAATHLPFVYKEKDGKPYLISHLAKANPQSKMVDGVEVLLVFQGPSAYISPLWYEDEKNVPTWNYVALHIRGHIRLASEAGSKSILAEIVQHFDPAYAETRYPLLDEAYHERLMRGIVAFEVEIEAVELKEKCSQNKSEEDRKRIKAALLGTELGEWMKKSTF